METYANWKHEHHNEEEIKALESRMFKMSKILWPLIDQQMVASFNLSMSSNMIKSLLLAMFEKKLSKIDNFSNGSVSIDEENLPTMVHVLFSSQLEDWESSGYSFFPSLVRSTNMDRGLEVGWDSMKEFLRQVVGNFYKD